MQLLTLNLKPCFQLDTWIWWPYLGITSSSTCRPAIGCSRYPTPTTARSKAPCIHYLVCSNLEATVEVLKFHHKIVVSSFQLVYGIMKWMCQTYHFLSRAASPVPCIPVNTSDDGICLWALSQACAKSVLKSLLRTRTISPSISFRLDAANLTTRLGFLHVCEALKKSILQGPNDYPNSLYLI